MMNKREFLKCSAGVVCGALYGGCMDDRDHAPDARKSGTDRDAAPSAWSIIALPDTQYYSEKHPEVFAAQTRWIVANKDKLNIKYVLHLGDITEHNNAPEWENARRAMTILDGHVPYALAPGNHDYGRGGMGSDRTTLLNDYFDYDRIAAWPTFGGARVQGELQNTFHRFEAGGQKWLVLALEWGPRDGVLEWAGQILKQYPDHRVILITHAYLFHDSTRYHWAARGHDQEWSPYSYGTAKDPDGTNDGEDIWNKLLKHHPSAVMTLNGHVLVTGVGYLKSKGESGNVVHQMLVNFQEGVRNIPRDGTAAPDQTISDDGSLRIMRFEPDGTVHVTDYSPHRDYYAQGPLHQFSMTIG